MEKLIQDGWYLEESTGEKSLGLCVRKDFLDTTPKTQFLKEKNC